MNNQVRLKGYVHNVRRAKSGTGSFRCFNFSLQVSENCNRQIVCYDPSKEKLLKGYQDSREPVKLVNFSKRKSSESVLEEDIILLKRSRIESVSNNDIVFEYDEGNSQEAERTYKTIGTIQSLRESEMISGMLESSCRLYSRGRYEKWVHCGACTFRPFDYHPLINFRAPGLISFEAKCKKEKSKLK